WITAAIRATAQQAPARSRGNANAPFSFPTREGTMARRDTELTAKPRNDAYTGMLIISLGAMILGSALLYVDYSRYPSNAPKDALKGPATGKDLANLQGAPQQPNAVPVPVVPDKGVEPKDKDKAAPKDKDKAEPKDKAAPKDKDKAEPKDKDKA